MTELNLSARAYDRILKVSRTVADLFAGLNVSEARIAEVLGISLVTNFAAGMTGEPLNHQEVLESGRAAASRMGDLLGAVVPRL